MQEFGSLTDGFGIPGAHQDGSDSSGILLALATDFWVGADRVYGDILVWLMRTGIDCILSLSGDVGCHVALLVQVGT